MGESIWIRTMEESDLEFADSLRAIVNWNQTPSDWRRFLDFEPNGCFVAEWNGSRAGTATTLRFGPDLAWIGMLLVHPEHRRKGIARLLLQTCVDFLQGSRCIKLDATPLGKQLYDQCGFKEEWSLARWERSGGGVNTGVVSCEAHPTLRPLEEADLEKCADLDTQAFGAARTDLLKSLTASSVTALCAWESPERLVGYGVFRKGSRADYLGPIVALSSATARHLILRLAASRASSLLFWDIPDPNPAATGLAEEMGFVKQRPLIRMFRNVNSTPGDPRKYFAIADPSLG